MGTPTAHTPRRLDREAGLTIIEVLVAALVLVAGSFATFGVLRTATVNNQRAKATQVALDRAQREMEVLRSLPNSQLAMTEPPDYSADPLDPDHRVNETNGTFALTRDPLQEVNPPYMVVERGSLYGGGFVAGAVVRPEEAFVSGDVSGTVHRYVVWRDDTSCGGSCPGTQDYKQIVVAVKLNTPGNQAGERGYVEVQSDFIDPTDSAKDDPIPPQGGQVNSPQQFFLSDTPCAADGVTEREGWPKREEAGDHPLHNTRGTCASGPQTGSTLGAPDALLLGAPPDPAPEDPLNPPVYNYSDDYLGQSTPETGKGIQVMPDDSGGCHFPPTGASIPQWQAHVWVTDPMPYDFTLTKNATLDFFTRSLSDLPYTGTLCIYLLDRHEVGSPVKEEENTVLTGAEGTYAGKENGEWPRSEWAEVRVPLSFDETTIPKNDRLGVVLSVSGSSGAGAVPILYDHPNYRTRIEIETPTPLNAG